ncbi:MAG: hypothetical protein CBD16_01720 [Betaproteobacteria bacterium TMED156]|nr:MAG: hypothetical protein CBD16_01720 [Betaproteobacteria bacterium TMED156]
MSSKNVLGEILQPCSLDPVTGFFRDGCCNTGPDDEGKHTVCVQVTEAFLQFSISKGNDLSTPRPEFNFPGLSAGDKWCVCASRWKEAAEVGLAPPVILNSTHENALELISKADLTYHALSE